MMPFKSSPVIISFLVVILELIIVVKTVEQSMLSAQRIELHRLTERDRPCRRWRNRSRMKSKEDGVNWRRNYSKRNSDMDEDLIFTIESIESCCPTVYEMIEPAAGRNRSGHLVELYQDERVRQRFYEVSCRQSVLNKPCKFLESRHHKLSKCIQQHSFTYALVRPPGVTSGWEGMHQQPWSLDYISVRSGCTCQVVNSRRRKKPYRN